MELNKARAWLRVQGRFAGFITAFLLFGTCQASLIDNGDGTITDTGSNLMWLKDGNFAQSSGYDSNGIMYWHQAAAWADGLVFAGYDDWRLPALIDRGNDGCNAGYSRTDCGWNTDTSLSELAFLFHESLGNVSRLDASGNSGPCPSTAPYCLQNVGPFMNLDYNVYYWTGTSVGSPLNVAWLFDFWQGYQTRASSFSLSKAIAVRSCGDAGCSNAVPIVPTWCLMMAGAIVAFRRQKTTKCRQ